MERQHTIAIIIENTSAAITTAVAYGHHLHPPNAFHLEHVANIVVLDAVGDGRLDGKVAANANFQVSLRVYVRFGLRLAGGDDGLGLDKLEMSVLAITTACTAAQEGAALA